MNGPTGQPRATDALDALLAAGTPADVRERYLSLADIAREGTFALVEEPVVVCDTETTGTDAKRDSLIEIAAVRLVGSEVTDTFQTFCDPHRHVPGDITKLTGICDADLADAPSPAAAVRDFAAFAGTDAIVAHNAPFDQAFIEAAATSSAVPPSPAISSSSAPPSPAATPSSAASPEDPPAAPQGQWLDSLALSRIVLPRLKNHNLADLADAFGLPAPSHRAGDDVAALCGLWRVLLAAVHTLPTGLARQIASISPNTDWPLRAIFQHAAAATPKTDFSLRRTRTDRVGKTVRAQRRDCKDDELFFASDDEVAAAFGPSGLLSLMYDGYEPRAPQEEMALAVNAALREERAAAIEAGTGVGKSMAYLVPLALAAKKNKITCGVATKTNALTDQLVFHELPRLADALGGLEYVTLKGYDHYPCLRKLERAMREAEDAPPNDIERLCALLTFITETHWGDLDALNLFIDESLRARIAANPNDCLKKHCPFHPRLCLLHGARRAAASADIVVTNHALLFCDAQADGGILPPIRHWVIDEAHGAESEARKQLSSSCSQIELASLLHHIAGPRASIISSIRAKADKTEGATMLYAPCTDIEDRVGTADIAALTLFESVKGLLSAADKAGERDIRYDQVTLWVGPKLRESTEWAALEAPGRALAEALEGLVRRMGDLITMCEEFPEALSAQQADLASASCSVRDQLDALVRVLDGTDESFVFSADLDRRPRRDVQALNAQKLDVGSELLSLFYPEIRSVVFTSATLATAAPRECDAAPSEATGITPAFAHFAHAVGIDRIAPEKVSCHQMKSTYDYDAHMGILVPTDIPEITSASFRADIEELLYDVHTSLGGSVLTLFTNRREMESLYHSLKPRLEERGLELAAQLKSSSAARLRERFIAEEGLSLFALKSFWEGFDAPGDTLRCVVIVRLPFTKPSDPLNCERQLRESRAWWRYTLPESIIDLKQAAGRLIRSSTDEGWLVLCDSRLRTKSYGRRFLDALPTTDVRLVGRAELTDALRHGH